MMQEERQNTPITKADSMNIYLRDDDNKIDDEILILMNNAAKTALVNEFGSDLTASGIDVSELPVELSVSIVKNDEIKELNAEFRNIDRVTDVLSFPQYDSNDDLRDELLDYADCIKEGEDIVFVPMLGDVVICYEKAAEQAEEYGTGIRRELIYLFVHSIFHLMGYDHMNDDEKKVMRAKEEQVMEAVGL